MNMNAPTISALAVPALFRVTATLASTHAVEISKGVEIRPANGPSSAYVQVGVATSSKTPVTLFHDPAHEHIDTAKTVLGTSMSL
jgi:hypothetical protein